MRTEVTVRVDDVLAILQPLAKQHNVERLSSLSAIVPDFDVNAAIDVEGILAEAGYVHPEKHEADVIASLDPTLADLREGLQALRDGDTSMAAIMLNRAFDTWPDAQEVVDAVLLTRTSRDRRQHLLLVA